MYQLNLLKVKRLIHYTTVLYNCSVICWPKDTGSDAPFSIQYCKFPKYMCDFNCTYFSKDLFWLILIMSQNDNHYNMISINHRFNGYIVLVNKHLAELTPSPRKAHSEFTYSSENIQSETYISIQYIEEASKCIFTKMS